MMRESTIKAHCTEDRLQCLSKRTTRVPLELEFGNVGFCGEEKTGVPGENLLGVEWRTNNKLNPHETSSPRI